MFTLSEGRVPMNHRMLRYPADWEWHMLTGADLGAMDADELTSLKRQLPGCAEWLDASLSRAEGHVTIAELAEGEDAVYGTLLIQLSEDDHDVEPLHYWVTAKRVVTLQRDLRFTLRLQRSPWEDKLGRCRNALEAFAVMLSGAMEPLHNGLDAFELRLSELEHTMRYRNRSDLLNIIVDRRYELLHWSHHYIAIKELEGSLKEAFMDTLTDSEGYRKLAYRMERVSDVLEHYAGEIDTLISMDEAITTFRGNDIMKTLTIWTVLFMPATVIGALWGMNLTPLPWAREPWGFASLCGFVVIVTLLIYLWLWRKGWTGDIVHARKRRRSLLAPEAGEREARARTAMPPRKKREIAAISEPPQSTQTHQAALPSRSRTSRRPST